MNVPSLPRVTAQLERGFGVDCVSSLSFFSFILPCSLLLLDNMAIFLLFGGSPQRNGVCVGGSYRRRKTVSSLSVALVGIGKRRDLSVVVAVGDEEK